MNIFQEFAKHQVDMLKQEAAKLDKFKMDVSNEINKVLNDEFNKKVLSLHFKEKK